MLTNSTTVKITDFNSTNETRTVNLKFNGSVEDVTGVYVEKFTICKMFPVYIPKLVVTDGSLVLAGKTQNSVDPTYTQLPYRMNLGVLIVNNSNNTYAMSNVRYVSNRNVNQPPSFNMSDEALSRNIVLNSEYFYMYSTLELTKMITDCIYKCMTACNITYNQGDVYIALLESGYYQLMVKSSLLQTMNIYFNYELRILFPFDFTNNLGLLTDDYQMVKFEDNSLSEFDNVTYSVAQTIFKSSRIYPFRNVIFNSNNLSIQPILNSNSLTSNIYNDKIIEILSFSLNIDTPDQANDTLEYQMSSLYRVLTLNSQIVPSNFNINVYMQTIDGYNVRLNLKKNEFVQLSLIFCA